MDPVSILPFQAQFKSHLLREALPANSPGQVAQDPSYLLSIPLHSFISFWNPWLPDVILSLHLPPWTWPPHSQELHVSPRLHRPGPTTTRPSVEAHKHTLCQRPLNRLTIWKTFRFGKLSTSEKKTRLRGKTILGLKCVPPWCPSPSQDTPVWFSSTCPVPSARPSQEAAQWLHAVTPISRSFPLRRLKCLPQSQLPGSPVQLCGLWANTARCLTGNRPRRLAALSSVFS